MNCTFTIGPVTNYPNGTTDVVLYLEDPGDFQTIGGNSQIALKGLSTSQVGMLTPGSLFTITFTAGAYVKAGG
jgi:hypothetical protein